MYRVIETMIKYSKSRWKDERYDLQCETQFFSL